MPGILSKNGIKNDKQLTLSTVRGGRPLLALASFLGHTLSIEVCGVLLHCCSAKESTLVMSCYSSTLMYGAAELAVVEG